MNKQGQNELNSQAQSEQFLKTMKTNLIGALNGDKEEQAWFYRRYATPIYCFLKKRGLTRDDAKDLTQDIIVKFLENKFLKYNFEKPFKSYLMAVAEHEAKSFKKKKSIVAKNNSEIFEELLRDAEKIEYKNDTTPEELFDLAYARQLFGEALKRVKITYANDAECPNRWNMFYDRFCEKLTWPQIANRYGYTRDQTRNLTLVILANLKKALYAELQEEQVDNKQLDSKLKDIKSILLKHK
jgi:RNA polymerase sigma factor (sigma-70 family)